MDMSKYIGEATAYDKKLMLERKEPLSWLKSISAFANTFGGVLLYGVDNDGNLVGLENAERDAEDISEMIKCLMGLHRVSIGTGKHPEKAGFYPQFFQPAGYPAAG